VPTKSRRDQQVLAKADVERTRIQERYRLLRVLVLGVFAVPLTILAAAVLVREFASVADAIAGKKTDFKFDLTTSLTMALSATIVLGGAGWAALRIRTQSSTTARMRGTQRKLQASLDAAQEEIASLKRGLRHADED
jgi:hypothetical protein